jgi:hypothetical protein
LPDRRLLGLLGIALVVSTVFTGVTFNVDYGERARFLASTMPAAIECSEQAIRTHSFDFMVTTDLPDVVVRCGMLIKRPDIPRETPWTEAGLAHKSLVTRLLDDLGTLSPDFPLYRRYTVEAEQGVEVEFIDFSDFLAAMGGEEILADCNTIYAVEDRDGEASFYMGIRHFFFESEATLLEVKYSSPRESEIFRSEALGAKAEGHPPISEAPIGRIHLHDLAAGDRVHVEVTANTQYMPHYRILSETPFCHEGIIRLVVVETGYGTAAVRTDHIA